MEIVDARVDPALVPDGSRAVVIAEHQNEYRDLPSMTRTARDGASKGLTSGPLRFCLREYRDMLYSDPMKQPRPPKPDTSIKDLARHRIRLWARASGRTQTDIARVIGRSQVWVSQYLSGGQDADIDDLCKLARVFGHTLTVLFEELKDPTHQVVLDAFCAIPEDDRGLALEMLQSLARPRLPARARPASGRPKPVRLAEAIGSRK